MGKDKASSFVIEQPLRQILDKLGVVHEELHIRKDKASLLLAFKKQYLDYEALEQLKQNLRPEQIRIYPQRYSHFTEQNIDHTGAIWCINTK
jgi:hypothetical protein